MALGTKYHGIYKVWHVRSRCRLVDGHWLWGGGVTAKGIIRMWAPRASDGKMAAQNGRHAVWQMRSGEPIPAGHKVFRTCGESLCMNPDHMVCRTSAEQGRALVESGALKGLPSKILANRKILLARSKVTPEVFQHILSSPKTGTALMAETGVGRSTISRIRRGEFKALGGVSAVASPFHGLGQRA